jgi:TIR domain
MKPLGKSIPVFLSHASADKPLVEDIIPYLTKQGLPVWYDKISIDYGEGILSAVQSGVQDSGAVLFFVTSSFLKSNWCKLEMEGFLHRYAGGQGVLLLPLVAHDVARDDLPFFLQGIKYLRLEVQLTLKDTANELLPVLSKHFKL